MKVLVFTSLFPNNVQPNLGVFIRERMAAVAKLYNCQIVVVAPVPYYPPIRLGWRSLYRRIAREEVLGDITVYHPRYLLIPKVAMFLQGWLMFLSLLPVVHRIRRSFPFDLIDAHYVYPDGFAAVLLGRVLRTPVVVSARGSDINLFVRFPMIRRHLQYTLSLAKHIITVSAALRGKVSDLGLPSAKISVIPNGVDRSKFMKLDKKEARELLGLPIQRPIVLSIGGLTPVKGFEFLIRAFHIVCGGSQQKKPYLVIIGDGPLRGKLKRIIAELQIEDDVCLAGTVAHGQLHRWYSAANVFCLASEREGWPNVVLEAMACGLPVVATAVGGIPEIITVPEVGMLCDRSPTALAQRIAAALEKNWDSQRIIQEASKYTWDLAAAAVRGVFDKVMLEERAAEIPRQTVSEAK